MLLPFTGSSPSSWNQYNYDSYDRLTSYVAATGKTTTYSYSGNSVTTVNEGVQTTRTYDAADYLTSVTDPAGTIAYTRRTDGKPTVITAPGGATTTIEYDIDGTPSSINAPGTGYRQFCTSTGRITCETDELNRTKYYTYDKFGRLTNVSMPEFFTVYKYNTEGRLTSDSS